MNCRQTRKPKQEEGTKTVSHDRIVQKVIAGALLGGGLALAGFGPAAGPAHADKGYGTWCPGQPLPQPYQYQKGPDGSIRLVATLPPDLGWDMNVCHDWHRRWIDQGNGASLSDTVEGSIPRMNCGPGWCPVPPGAGT